jgi:hypothetical protein
LHEVHHIFGIGSGEYDNFYDRDNSELLAVSDVLLENQAAPFALRVKSPKALEWARDHYNCPNAIGIPLENTGGDGTAGAHWDKYIVGNELMNPQDYFNVVNSGLNFALTEDMGHYVANYDMQEQLLWGKDAGCNIFSGECSDNPQTCTEGEFHCSPAHFSIGECSSDDSSEGCAMFHEVPFGDCRLGSNKDDFDTTQLSGLEVMYFGNGGRCIEGQIHEDQAVQQGNCLQVTCNSVTSLTISVLDNDHECTDSNAGQQIDLGNSLYIVCPDPAVVCMSELSCPNDCNHHGRCLSNGTCWCYSGYSGNDCGTEGGDPYDVLWFNGEPEGWGDDDDYSSLRNIFAIVILGLFLKF